MEDFDIACPKCKLSLDPKTMQGGLFQCKHCYAFIHVYLYPPMFTEMTKGEKPETILLPEQASCFFHVDKLAVTHCEECGIFLCNLCDIEIDHKHFCSKCMSSQMDNIKSLQSSAVLYDAIILALAVLQIFFFTLSFIFVPLIIIGSIYFRKKMKVPYYRGHWRFNLALIITFGYIVLGVFLTFVLMVYK